MFGISGDEFLVILIVAILVIPARDWPDVARWLARVVKFFRNLIWKISDGVNEIKDQAALEEPITKMTQQVMDDARAAFATPIKKNVGAHRDAPAGAFPRGPHAIEDCVGWASAPTTKGNGIKKSGAKKK